MLRTIILGTGLGVMVAFASAPAPAQTTPAGSSAAVPMPNRASVSGTHRARSHHRSTLNRQKARATAEQSRQRRAQSGN